MKIRLITRDPEDCMISHFGFDPDKVYVAEIGTPYVGHPTYVVRGGEWLQDHFEVVEEG